MEWSEILQKVWWIGVGSALGGNARYWITLLIQQRWGGVFPLGTFVVNISGAFLLGLFTTYISERLMFPYTPILQRAFAIGFIGSYTTFSTLEYDTVFLAQNNYPFLAAINLLGSALIGFFGIVMGGMLARLL